MLKLDIMTTKKEELIDITQRVTGAIKATQIKKGTAVIYVPHTTCGLTINEKADPDVAADILLALKKAVPDSLPYAHLEGNSTAHIKASVMGSSLQIMVEDGELQLGRWQGIFLAEFDGPRKREIWIQANEDSLF
ncbi:MAG: secondary thiamine-phosphate synthase enzyme YjbQ [Acidobacteriota bacterium]|nr:secondary thiamine-phosphate synthase enzyme YjbQ [Acidobacteriota bacterium]